MFVEILLAIITPPLLYVLATYIYHLWEVTKYPSGPFPLPVIGNLHLLGKKPHQALADMAKVYGNVFSLSFGMNRAVIVNTIEPTKEALITKNSHFAGRPTNMYTAELISRGYLNIGFSDYNSQFVMIRKFGHSSLKMFGENKKKMQNLMVLESEDLHARLRKTRGSPIDVRYEFGLSLLNIISAITFGHRYERNDPEFKDMIDFAELIFGGLNQCEAVAFLPWLKYFPLPGLKKVKKGIKIRDEILTRKLLEHKKSFDGENIRDVADALLKVSSDKNNGGFNFTDDHLEMILNDILVGGYETTLTVLRWSVLYLIHWPKYQEQIYEEMMNVVGTDRYPEYNDRISLPFTHAAINETLRMSSVAPLAVPHKATRDSSIGGKCIPKGAMVMFNIWQIHNDQRFWENSAEFNPYRWLDDKGAFITKERDSYLPFSAGRRGCMGESLAKVEVFHFYTRMIRDFKMEKDPDAPLPSLDGLLGLTLSPVPFTVVFRPRNKNEPK